MSASVCVSSSGRCMSRYTEVTRLVSVLRYNTRLLGRDEEIETGRRAFYPEGRSLPVSLLSGAARGTRICYTTELRQLPAQTGANQSPPASTFEPNGKLSTCLASHLPEWVTYFDISYDRAMALLEVEVESKPAKRNPGISSGIGRQLTHLELAGFQWKLCWHGPTSTGS
ncbi:hypothetical protein CISG_08401 [Coccidioides immitis RMSCC 3703]|uniref:Uncharacterized protein n=1 Tax=Coccidioides immitis RMSCC 3703 TaxID=454286 RepID=A0A0J8R773_COCIT|nr:hypothetical protein CISG_08401 [Coccidioides immitis RMSCC 3703]